MVGAEGAPWALAAAVSRFGTLSGLRLIRSSPDDVNPSTPTLSFEHARYSSRHLAFVPVEWSGQAADPGTPFGHAYLQRPTAQRQALFARYGGGSIPFVDIGNRYILPQVQYDPAALVRPRWPGGSGSSRPGRPPRCGTRCPPTG